jgi:hypothetical protein
MALGVAMAALAGGARAAGTGPAEAAGCDFFQAELIGVLCGGTGYVAPGGQGSEETINRTSTLNSGFPHGSHGVQTERWTYILAYESLTAAISPWQGVRFHVSGEAFQYAMGIANSLT